jgi:anti-sigma factor RsiW
VSIEIQDDWLDRKLQEAAPYIEDDGFTARVLRQLPQPMRRSEFLRSFILVAMSALASALTYVLSDGGRFILVEMFRLTTIPTVWVVAFALTSGMLVMAGGIFAAMYKTNQIQS